MYTSQTVTTKRIDVYVESLDGLVVVELYRQAVLDADCPRIERVSVIVPVGLQLSYALSQG